MRRSQFEMVSPRQLLGSVTVTAFLLEARCGVAVAATSEQGLSQKAVEIAGPFGFPITNSMVVSWCAFKDFIKTLK